MVKTLSAAGAIIGGILIALMVFAAVYASTLNTSDPITANIPARFSPPSEQFPFGTDGLGRDMQARVLHGSRTTLQVSAGAVLISLVAGGVLAAIAGTAAGVGRAVACITRLLAAGPGLLLAVLVIAAFGQSTLNLTIAVSIALIPGFARLFEGIVLSLADADSNKNGRELRIVGAIIARFSLNMALAMLLCGALSFIGMGVPAPTPELGGLIGGSREFLRVAPHLIVYPGFYLTISILAFNIFGESLNSLLLSLGSDREAGKSADPGAEKLETPL
jgi:peptide/nickel transport system permease protein